MQACLGVLLHIDESITKDGLEKFPLAEYAAKCWVGHALFDDVSRNIEDRMKRLFDPDNPHLAVWVWIYDPDCRVVELIPLRARRVRAHMPLHHAQPPEIAQATLNFLHPPPLRGSIIPVSNVCLRVQNTRDISLSLSRLVTQQNSESTK